MKHEVIGIQLRDLTPKNLDIEPLSHEHGASILPLLAKRDLSRLGSGERNATEGAGPRGPSERERASQQGRGEEPQGTGGNTRLGRIHGCILTIVSAGLLLGLCSCASDPFVSPRPFNFQTDSFAFPNDLVWEYHYDANGKWVHNRREPEPDYTHHCFVVARSARQFFENARFDTNQPIATETEYRHLIRRVVSIDPRHALPDSKKIVIPGYANLREFSVAQEKLLKSECGGAWQSYTQRGHWRMVFFFSRATQERAAERFLGDLKDNRPPVVHLTTFPRLTINHAILLFGAKETENEILFSVYDPNKPDSPKVLTYNRASRTFTFAANDYWPGGKINVYEVYRSWDY